MATKITMTIPQDLDTEAQHDLRLLLQDAFHEFTTKRYPAGVYVADRYAGIMGPDEAKEKVKQVERRVELGRAMHAASFDVSLETDAPLRNMQVVKEALQAGFNVLTSNAVSDSDPAVVRALELLEAAATVLL